MNLIHALRDAEARFTGFGQGLRCHRSWRRAVHVTVWYRPSSGTFLLCDRCFQTERLKADAGLILQGYAARHLDRYGDSHGAEERREILAAYGVAHHYPMELSRAWGERSYDVRVAELQFPIDDLGKMAEKRASQPKQGSGLTAEEEARWDEAVRSGEVVRRLSYLIEDPEEAPGWDGAGSDTPNGDMEANRG